MKRSIKIFILAVILGISCPMAVFAEESTSLTLTVTPPLYQVTQPKGSSWSSQLKVVNSNNYDISVLITPQDFHPDGETGNAVFEYTPVGAPDDTRRMSGWLTVPTGVVTIKRGVTAEIPFSIHVPENADPGGHYGALLVSTHPEDVKGGSGAGISSGVSSLIFLRIPGDVIEKGAIRDFYTDNTIIQTPNAHFILRFENQGNVHLVPQGEIVIKNMWGKERGKIKINESSTFGNVLPASTRKFEFAWNELDPSPLEVGRYTAVATIVYGSDAKSTVERTVYFWIVPWKPVSGILGTLLFFIWITTWLIRRYIRKALQLEGAYHESVEQVTPVAGRARRSKQPELTLAVLRRPLTIDTYAQKELQSAKGKNAVVAKTKQSSLMSWLRRYRPVLVFILVLAVGFSLIGWYFVEVFQDERAYHVEAIRPK